MNHVNPKIVLYPLRQRKTADTQQYGRVPDLTAQAGEQSIEARYEDETIWLSQKFMAALFAVDVRTVSEHLKNIFASGELNEDPVIRKFRITESDSKSHATNHYNLDAIISLGYWVNSVRATQFRQWATQVLREFAIKGYLLDKKRMENGSLTNSIPGLGIEPASDAIGIQFVSALHKVSNFFCKPITLVR
jgi:hypothetical protein